MFGTVSKYDRVKGYGFILPDDQSLPDFFTCAKLVDANRHHRFLIPGQRVEFDPVDLETRPAAHNVRVVSAPTGEKVARQ
jgi:cold shock CspA family protein